MGMRHFWVQNGPFAPNFFLEKILNIIFIYLLAPFIVHDFKKFLLWIQSYEDALFFWTQNRPFTQKKTNKPIPRKLTDRRTRKGQTLFHRSLSEMARGSKNKC